MRASRRFSIRISIGCAPRLPSQTLVLDMPGLARVMSLPPGEDSLTSPYVRSYRIRQGILHNPKSDRRTTKGIFHIAEGGLPVPDDKIAVPKATFGALLAPRSDSAAGSSGAAVHRESGSSKVRLFATLLLRPLVCPRPGRARAERWRSASSRPPAW